MTRNQRNTKTYFKKNVKKTGLIFWGTKNKINPKEKMDEMKIKYIFLLGYQTSATQYPNPGNENKNCFFLSRKPNQRNTKKHK